MLVVDTSVWIDYFNDRDTPQVARLDIAVEVERIGIGDLILCEILQGMRTEAKATRALRLLAECAMIPMMNPRLAIRAAENYRHLRRRGVTVRSTVDCLIATAVIADDHLLLHNDRDFDQFEKYLGLHVLHPESDQS